jgi:hypothetical protein
VQKWFPQPYLPAFGEFQGSGIPYWILLSVQIVILAAMGHVSWRVQRGLLQPKRRKGVVLRALGGVYMTGSVARIVVGVSLPDAPSWFTAWIPALFHVAIASFVLVLASYHLHEPQ